MAAKRRPKGTAWTKVPSLRTIPTSEPRKCSSRGSAPASSRSPRACDSSRISINAAWSSMSGHAETSSEPRRYLKTTRPVNIMNKQPAQLEHTVNPASINVSPVMKRICCCVHVEYGAARRVRGCNPGAPANPSIRTDHAVAANGRGAAGCGTGIVCALWAAALPAVAANWRAQFR
jgi:hypothetical protein